MCGVVGEGRGRRGEIESIETSFVSKSSIKPQRSILPTKELASVMCDLLHAPEHSILLHVNLA